MQPLLTIATCVLNAHQDFLATARSLPEVLPAWIEWVVVDGGSSDGTLEAIKSEHRIARYISERDNGVYFAYNRAVDMASARHMWFLNAGDLAEATTLLECGRRLSEDSRNSQPTVICHAVHMPTSGRTLFAEPDKLRDGMSVPTPGVLFPTAAVLAHNGFDTSYRIAADFDLLMRIERGGEFPFMAVKDVLAYFEPVGMSSIHSDRGFFEECVALLRQDPSRRVHCLLRAARRAVFHVDPKEVSLRRWRYALRLARRLLY